MFFGWKENFNKRNLDQKMRIFLSIAIILCASTILVISTFSAITSITSKSKSLAKGHINTISKSFASYIEQYYNIAVSIIPDTGVQEYLKEEMGSHGYYQARENITKSLRKILYQQPRLVFTVLEREPGIYQYVGQQGSLVNSKYYEVMNEDYAYSIPTGYGKFRMSINNAYHKEENFSVTFYQPVYDMSRLVYEIGMIVLNLEEEIFNFIYEQPEGNMKLDTFLVNDDGRILLCEDKNLIGSVAEYVQEFSGEKGDFNRDGKLYVYCQVENTNFFVVGSISMVSLMRDSIATMLGLVIIIAVMLFIGISAANHMARVFYGPLYHLAGKMELISGGRLDVRINEEDNGEDFRKIAKGFNVMMDRINELLLQVKKEQHQIEQIRLNALHSQIQPHFLYNTLECIHWQAAADGNKEVSTLVKALAAYYRLCLSKGKDVIKLEQEISHINSYLIIQNMRYDHIIESEIRIDPSYYKLNIPKMTLQPLIENCIYHGLKVKEGKRGKVIIDAYEQENKVILTVADSGTGMTEEQIAEMNNSISVYDEAFGFGVNNVNKRIELLFGREYGLYYKRNESGGVTVEVRLPRDVSEWNEEYHV